ncbi:mRNA cleavage and polyadenylation factor subunit [Polyrhizophydium stewartii]|uniref:mRNA cleavage and polyadenylation factor subunit n=1 Tax=Polyrhizophydium stewartii TaxID=2732419 RepID=A0ABR4NFH1_9FUNG
MTTPFFSLCKELCPPSGIDHVVSARFTAPTHRNLVVARGPLLQLWLVLDDHCPPDEQKLSPPRTARLELIAEFRLHGNITSIGVVPVLATGSTEYLLLSFKDAKMSLIEFSQASQRLTTVSLHYFEREEYKREPSTDRPPPEIRVDPQGRCAAMRFYGDKLAILPFRQEGALAATDPSDPSSKYPFLPSFVMPFTDIDPSVRNVIDFTFLFGYFEPVLAIMYQQRQTWTGRLSLRKDTVSVVVVSLDIIQKKYPVLYRIDGLPYNCTTLLPVPSPLGGIVILSHNAIIHADQVHSPGIACIVNGYFDHEASLMPMPNDNQHVGNYGEPLPPPYPKPKSIFMINSAVTDLRELAISLDGSRAVFSSPDTMLLVLRNGEMLQVDLIGDDGAGRSWMRRKGGVRRFAVTDLGLRMTSPAALVHLSDTSNPLANPSSTPEAATLTGTFTGAGGARWRYAYIFAASRTADAQLLQILQIQEAAKAVDDAMDAGDDDLDTEIYGQSRTAYSSRSRHAAADSAGLELMRIRLCDSMTVVSPLRDFTTSQPAETSSFAFEPKFPSCDLEVVAASGDGPHGSLVILNRQVRPQIVTSSDLLTMEEMWSVHCATKAGPDHDAQLDQFHKYIVLSHQEGTLVLNAGDEIADVDESGFFQSGPTVGVGTLLRGTLIVQIHPDGVLLLDTDAKRLQEMTLGDQDNWVVSCAVADPFVILHMNTGFLILLQIDQKTGTLIKKSETSSVGNFSLFCDPTGGRILPTNREALASHAWMLPKNVRTHLRKRVDETLVDADGEARIDGAVGTIKPGKPRAATSDAAAMLIDADKHKKEDDDNDDELYGSSKSNGKNGSNGATDEKDDDDFDDAEMDEIYGASKTKQSKRVDSKMHLGSIDTPTHLGAVDMEVDATNASAIGSGGAESRGRGAQNGVNGKPDAVDAKSAPPKFWCFVTTDKGHLLVYSLPDFRECCAFPLFDALPNLAADMPNWRGIELKPTYQELKSDVLDEILVVNLGTCPDRQAPYLIARTVGGDLVVYRIFVCPASAGVDDMTMTTSATPRAPKTQAEAPIAADFTDERLAIRLQRVPHDQITRDLRFYVDTEGDKLTEAPEQRRENTFLKKQHLKPFSGIGNASVGNMYSGVFVTGSRPCWIMVATSTRRQDLEVTSPQGEQTRLESCHALGTGVVRVHPMSVDGPVRCFAPLHNVNVPNGFMFINWRGALRLCQLPPHFNYDFPWPVCKVPLGRTVHRVAFHHSSSSLVMATSVPERFDVVHAQHASAVAAAVIDAKDPLPESERRVTGMRELAELKPGMYEAMVARYRVEIVSPVTWETIDSIEFSEAEAVFSLQPVYLSSKETTSGKKLFIAVGTGYTRSEDLASRGKLHVYDIIDVVPDPNNPHSNRKFKHIHSEEERSPFTAICNVNDYLLAAVGPKVIMYQLEDGELGGVAFMDVNIFVVSLSSVKNLIQICDIRKSVWFVAFQEEPAKLALLGKDVHTLQGSSANILVDNSQLGLLVADGERNLHIMTYSPYNVQSLGGDRLIRRGEFHLGQQVSKLVRMRRKNIVRGDTPLVPKQYLNIGVTTDGALIVVSPVSEKIYKRLYALYSRMVTNLEHAAGLNPRGFRQLQQRVRSIALSGFMGPPGPRGILDGDLLFDYAQLSRAQQRGLANAIGSNDDRLLDDLLEVLAGADYF